jgi:L-cysteine S-thiosulfotransferase
MRLCSRYRNKPPRRVAEAIQRSARGGIVYPSDGILIGDWKAGEAIAQSGYGQRFTDVDSARPNGGNCYACHRIDPAEQSYGTLGPDLARYGRIKGFSGAAARKVYEQIYNSHSHLPCSVMPRFGAGGTLSISQIKDLVGLLMAPESPTNR